MKQTAAPSTAATAEPARITQRERLAIIKRRASDLLNKPPAGVMDWPLERVRSFKAAASQLQLAASVSKALGPAQSLAAAYGRSLADLDPCCGSPE